MNRSSKEHAVCQSVSQLLHSSMQEAVRLVSISHEAEHSAEFNQPREHLKIELRKHYR